MLTGHYQLPLVAVSVLVAILASATALAMSGRVAASITAGRRWLVGGAVVMGIGIWAMHFIGMLAFRLPIPLGYDFRITLASLLIAIASSTLALRQARQPQLRPRHLARGALLMGGGIALMHYTGMAAMRMEPGIVYDLRLVAASVAIAVAASGAALWLGFQLRGSLPQVWLARGAGATVMGIAIAGMHYTGMAAAGFPEGSICRAAGQGYTQNALAVMIGGASLLLLGATLLVAIYDARLEARSEAVRLLQATAVERQSLLARESAARAEAERLSAMKDDFLAILSHELRTPLNAILGWTQLLQQNGREGDLRRGLEVIERNARAQAQLIDDLLDMNRIISGRMRLELKPLQPAPVVQAALETVRPMALKKGIRVDAEVDEEAEAVCVDAARLQQVMWNLLVNAVKFTPEGGAVRVCLAQKGGGVEITVADTGIGIAPDFLPHVFDRFRQADSSTARRHGGLGLGLAIVRQLVELHGGTIAVSSAGAGQGASFALRLPFAPKQATTTQDTDAPAPATRLAGISVLVVDDEPDALELSCRILADCAADVVVAASAAEAMEMLCSRRPQVMVSDIGMPETDGYALLRQARLRHPDLPTVALTAFAHPEDRQRALAAGFNAYVAKPVDAAKLAAAVAMVAKARPEVGMEDRAES
ncbi:MHYT domain-containing protein [Noviherbaspirillum pedocola]|uniref:Virulence sensor protein BvgS n=1 Tax=Noviherbaspirillum pedocola TaxID=2801341 RepID=A0A934T475_9BURK|nr:MHYT domain-containing protein [Noviherbaspirillum pedocola]MBK4738893.1 response regulator [Noviherbaspirillum pedocola]